MSTLKEASQRPASLMQTVRAVAWSFLGIRRSAGLEEDVQKLNPVHVVIGGVSLVTTYRDSFREEVRATGIDGLIKSLVAKNQQMASK